MEIYNNLLEEWPKGEDYVDYIMALDESGTSEVKSIKKNLQKNINDPVWFVLSGIIFDLKTMKETKQKIIAFKKKYWPDNGEYCGRRVVLHSTEMRHRSNAFSNKKIRNYDVFLDELCQIICDSSFRVISVGINKTAHIEQYRDPYPVYEYALVLILERYLFNIKNGEKGTLLFESRNGGADKQLLESAKLTFKNGTRYVRGINFEKIKGIYFNPKRTKDSKLSYFMLEFADLAAYSIYRKLTYDDESKIFKCMEKKFVDYPNYNGHGLKIVES